MARLAGVPGALAPLAEGKSSRLRQADKTVENMASVSGLDALGARQQSVA
jgi:hypothetical protein